MSQLEVELLSKRWGSHNAVHELSFAVEPGEFIALLGPSGCGKSTTLNMLAGLEAPSSGRVLLDGRYITHLPPGKRGLSMVFQSYALFPHLSVKENILFGLKARRVSKDEQSKRLKRVIDLVDLGDHLTKKPAQLSGGQCQRVALARAIVAQAPLCLMDEPLSNLDARLRNEMRSEIRSLQQQLGMTVLYVTHDQVEAMSMADRILLINQGQLEQCATPNTLYHQPATSFVASFIGNPPMNLLNRKGYQLGIRPEHIRISDEGLPAIVHKTDYHGADTYLDVQLFDLRRNQTAKEHLLVRLAGHQLLAQGSRVCINWDARNEHHFHSETGSQITPTARETAIYHPLATEMQHAF